MRNLHVYIALLFSLVICFACEDENVDANFVTTDISPLSISLEKQPEKYGEWVKVIAKAGYTYRLNAEGEYTMYVPTNEALDRYYQKIGKAEISEGEAKELVLNHLFAGLVKSGDYRSGCIRDTNMLGDYIPVEFTSAGSRGVILNKQAKITAHDIETTNGFYHEIDNVIVPFGEITVANIIAANKSYSIFYEALEKTGLIEKLNKETVINYYGKEVKDEKTVFVVPDEVFSDYDIADFNDLANKYADEDDYLDEENGLYRFIAYHILPKVKYTNQLLDYFVGVKAANYETLCKGEGVQVSELKGRIILNPNSFEEEELTKYSTLNIDPSNHGAKNGCIHVTEDLMDIREISAVKFTWLPATLLADLKIPEYKSGDVKKIFSFDSDLLPELNWETKPEQIQVQYKHTWVGYEQVIDNHYLEFDLARINTGWIEVETPIVSAGSYGIKTAQLVIGKSGIWKIYIDDKYIGTTNLDNGAGMNDNGWFITRPLTNYIEFEKTSKHKIKFEYLSGNGLFAIGDIHFEPVTKKN